MTDTLRTLYSMAAVDDLEMQSFDIETAFLNGTPKHNIYVRQVTGFRDHTKPNHVMLLNKALYGTCQAHREFNDEFDTKMKLMGFTVCPVDNSLYLKQSGSSFIHIPMHVGDGMAFSNDMAMLSQFREDLKAFYKFRWNEHPSLHLGIHITQDRSKRTIILNQSHYCEKMLERFSLSNCNGVKTPLPTTIHPYTPVADEAEEIEEYHAAVGMLNFLSVQTRPDIGYAVGYLAR